LAPSMPLKSQEESISSDEADERPRSAPTEHEWRGLRVLALRRAPDARSLSAVFDGQDRNANRSGFGARGIGLAGTRQAEWPQRRAHEQGVDGARVVVHCAHIAGFGLGL
jgi:hypothetical protein